MERAESLARLSILPGRCPFVPQSIEAANQSWKAIIVLNSLEEAFGARYQEVTAENVLRFMVCDADNHSSISSCLRMPGKIPTP